MAFRFRASLTKLVLFTVIFSWGTHFPRSGLFSTLASASGGSKSLSSNTSSNLLVYLQNLPSSLEPYKSADVSTQMVVRQIYNNLFEYDTNNTLIPKLVHSVAWSRDKKSLYLTLRDDIHFSNGDPLTSGDVVNSINESRRELGVSVNWAFAGLKAMKATNPLELEFTFKRPHSLFPAILASLCFGIFKRDTQGNIYGTGDYEVVVKNKNHLVLNKVRSSDPGIAQLVFDSTLDPEATYHFADSQRADTPAYLTKLEFAELLTIVYVPNFRSEVFKDKEARCQFLHTLEDVAPKVFTKWNPGSLGLPFSKQLFTTPDTSTRRSAPRDLQVSIVYGASLDKFDQALQYQLAKSLRNSHINATLTRASAPEFFSAIEHNDFDGLMFSYMPDFLHAYSLLAPLLGSKQQSNFGGYSNPEVDRMLNQILETQDIESQNAIFAKLLQRVHEDCGVALLGSQMSTIYYSPDLEKPQIGQLGIPNLHLNTLKFRRDR